MKENKFVSSKTHLFQFLYFTVKVVFHNTKSCLKQRNIDTDLNFFIKFR